MSSHSGKTTSAGVTDPTHFCNVDLDVYSRSRLEPLVAAFGTSVRVNYVGTEARMFSAHLSLPSYGQSAETLTRGLCRLIERLPQKARKLWDGARRREFNVGIEAGFEPYSHEIRLGSETLARVARLGGSILITTYAPQRTAAPRSSARARVRRK